MTDRPEITDAEASTLMGRAVRIDTSDPHYVTVHDEGDGTCIGSGQTVTDAVESAHYYVRRTGGNAQANEPADWGGDNNDHGPW